MSQSVGELFVDLGIKGTDKTIGAIAGVKQGLSDTASMSLEAKAGIVAAMYALERLFATSGAAGTGLTNLNSLLGVSARTLQQYDYAARQVGMSNGEMEGSFKSLQGAMMKTLMGEGAPKGLARVGLLTGGITTADIERFAKQPQLLIQRLQEYAGKEGNTALRNETLRSFGVGDNMISALTRQAFRPSVLNKAPTYSDRELGALDKANIAWSNLGTKIEMAIGHFNAKHGGQLVHDLSRITDQVIKLVEAFTKLTEKLHVFEVIGKVFEGWTKIFGLATGGVNAITGAVGDKKKRGALEDNVMQFFTEMPGVFSAMMSDLKNYVSPPVSPVTPGPTGNQATINQNMYFQHDGKDAAKTSVDLKKATKDAYYQQVQGQGS